MSEAPSESAGPIGDVHETVGYGGFWRRVAAALIDGIMLMVINGILRGLAIFAAHPTDHSTRCRSTITNSGDRECNAHQTDYGGSQCPRHLTASRLL